MLGTYQQETRICLILSMVQAVNAIPAVRDANGEL
jgi:hypothetical protein